MGEERLALRARGPRVSADLANGLIVFGLFVWGVIGFVVGALVKNRLEDEIEFTEKAEWFGAIMAGILSPLVLPIAVPVGLYVAARFLVGGFRELYRGFFPKKAKLPEARVIR